MKNLFIATIFLFITLAIEGGKNIYPKGSELQHCDYCKADFSTSHFPCVLKAVKGRINTSSGRVEFAIGQPISGLAVKITKNNIDSLSLTSNEKGEIELNNLPQGSYKLRVMLPATNPKSELAGRVVGGIILRIGKKPTPLMLALISDANGDIQLNNLEPGDYRIVLTAPTDIERNSDLYRSYKFENFNPNFKGNR